MISENLLVIEIQKFGLHYEQRNQMHTILHTSYAYRGYRQMIPKSIL
jgi:hypothetical protein